ncbi:unnamed protein product [Sympodiomycopsis kandeliae]
MSGVANAHLAERVASAVLELHQAIAPPTGSLVHNGAIEWTCMACICLVIKRNDQQSEQVVPIGLGTGTKTIPYVDAQDAHGDVIHDSHAEVLARRAARKWLAERILVESSNTQSDVIEGIPCVIESAEAVTYAGHRSATRKLKDNVKIWWYISTLPCGECSMPHLMRQRAEQDGVDAEQIKVSGQVNTAQETSVVTRGRNVHLSSPPRLRTVPGRADAPPSLSHSCTDKLLQWSILGWQGSILSGYLEPVRIDAIVMSTPDASYSSEKLIKEVRRGLDVNQRSSDPNFMSQDTSIPEIFITTQTFSHSQDRIKQKALKAGIPETDLNDKVVPSWGSTNWIRPSSLAQQLLVQSTMSNGGKSKDVESLVNGIRRGAPLKRGQLSVNFSEGQKVRAPLSSKSRSRLCKLEWFIFIRQFSAILMKTKSFEAQSYADAKGKSRHHRDQISPTLNGIILYRHRKRLLRGADSSLIQQQQAVQSWLSYFPSKKYAKKVEGGQGRQASPPVQDGLDQGTASPADMSRDSNNLSPLAGWLTTPTSVECFTDQGLRVEPDTSETEQARPLVTKYARSGCNQ